MSAEGWKTVRLEDALETLIDYRGKTPKKSSSGVPLITAKIVKNGFIQEPNEFIREQDYVSWMVRGFPQMGDVILTTEAPLGEVAQLNNEGVALAQRIVTLRGKKGLLDNSYLKYFLKSEIGQSRLKERETGTTVTGIKQSELRKVEIDVPPFHTQTRIAEILFALDDKIELNRQTNATLDAIAQVIFKEWFVDFRFPGATGELQDSELGPIPKGWKVYRLGDLIDSVSVTHKFEKKEAIFLNTSDIEAGKVLHHNYTDVERLPGQAKKSIQKMDILFTEIRPANKRFALIDFDAHDYVVSTKLMVLRLKTNIHPIVIYNYLTNNNTLNWLQHLAESRSGTFPQITFNHVRDLQLTLPKTHLLTAYSNLAWAIFQRIKAMEGQNSTLSSLRDALLPKLMSGDIAV